MSAPILNDKFTCAELVYFFRCSKCKRQESQSWHLSPASAVPLPSLPREWRRLNEFKLLCPEHSVVVLIDGEVTP